MTVIKIFKNHIVISTAWRNLNDISAAANTRVLASPEITRSQDFLDCIIIKQFYGAKRSIFHDSSSIFEYKNRS